jgi:hypothetical protein
MNCLSSSNFVIPGIVEGCERNKDLTNIKKTKLLREMIVPGIINSPCTAAIATHSITSSARASNPGGSCTPSCRATFWFTTNSNSVGA